MLTPERAIQIEQTAIRKGLRLKREHFEQTNSGELVLQDMLLNMEDIHGLLSRSLTAGVYDSDLFSVYSAVYNDNVFFGPRLVDLLDTARTKNPMRNDSVLGKYGTLADWRETDEKILNAHSIYLEPYWSEFMVYQKDPYIQATATWHPEEISENLESRRNQLIRRDIAIKNLDQLVKQRFEDENEIELISSLQHYLKEHALLAGINLGSYEKLSAEQVLGITASLPTKARKEIIDNGFLSPSYTVVDTQRLPNPNPVYDDYRGYNKEKAHQYLGKDRYKIFLDYSWMEVRLDPDGTVVELGREIYDYQNKGLIPHFAWVHVKNTGQRLYLSSQVPEWIREGLDSRSNTYLGLTVAKHLSQVKFPSEERLSTQHRPQLMREAQIVMQASKRRSEIMPFFPTFEEFIRTHLQAA